MSRVPEPEPEPEPQPSPTRSRSPSRHAPRTPGSAGGASAAAATPQLTPRLHSGIKMHSAIKMGGSGGSPAGTPASWASPVASESSSIFHTPFLDGGDRSVARAVLSSRRGGTLVRPPPGLSPGLSRPSSVSRALNSTARTGSRPGPRLEGPRPIRPREREALLACALAGRSADGGDEDAASSSWRHQRLWSESNLMQLSNCAAVLARDGRVVAAATFAVCDLATAATLHTGLDASTVLRLGVTVASAAADEYHPQARVCLRSAVRQHEAQGVMLSVVLPCPALTDEDLAALGFSAAESGVSEYALLRSDAEMFYRRGEPSDGVVVSLLEDAPGDGVLRALHWVHASERSTANQLTRNLAQTRRVHTLPSTFTKIARKRAELVAYLVCRYPAELADGGFGPLVFLEGGGDELALGMLIRDALLERRQEPGTPTLAGAGTPRAGEDEPLAAVGYGYSQPTALGNVLEIARENMLAVGDERRRVLQSCTHHIRISQPVEALRSLAVAGALGSRNSTGTTLYDSGVEEFSLTVFDEDDAACGGDISGTLISFRRSHSTTPPTGGEGLPEPPPLPLCLGVSAVLPPPAPPGAPPAASSPARNLVGLQCVSDADSATAYVGEADGSAIGLGAGIGAALVDEPELSYVDESRSQISLSVSALGRQVEDMGARVATWSAAKAPRPAVQ